MNARIPLATLLGFCCSLSAEVIAEWSFNGTTSSARGQGSVSLIGGATASYASGCPADPSPNNTAWNTTSYPAQGTSNKTAGVELRVSTQGYADLSLNWQHRVSGTASRYLRLQYSVDGESFVDLPAGVIESQAALVFQSMHVSLAGVPALADNPRCAFRIVSEFEGSATGWGTDEYVPTYATNTYSRSGTIRFDLVQVVGTRIPGANTPPSISAPGAQTLRVNTASAPLAFSVSDAEDGPQLLLVTGTSSDPGVVTGVNILGDGSDRHAVLTSGPIPGNTTVTMTVLDGGGCSSSASFPVVVLPANTPPFISSIAATNMISGGPLAPFEFLVSDMETPAQDLTIQGSSANTDLVPSDPEHICFGGAGSNRFVTILPVAGRSGIAPITLSVSDGSLLSTSSFAVAVRVSPGVLVCEPFDYADGSVCAISGGFWRNRSGPAGACVVRGGELELTGSSGEDIFTALPGAPYAVSTGAVLYASFRFRFLQAPKAAPEYFAHFVCGNALRGRVYAGATDVWPGAFRLHVANGSETNKVVPWTLTTNVTYQVVTRYDVDSARTTLWLNSSSEADLGIVAVDEVTPMAVSWYGFRQDSGLGTTLLVDNLRVGLSFVAVTQPELPALSIAPERDRFILHWAGDGYTLETAESAEGPFVSLGQAVSPYTNRLEGARRFFRLNKSF